MSIYKFISIISIFAVSFLFPQDVSLSLNGNDLIYESSADIAGFQFTHNGCVSGASGGDAAANGFTLSASGSTVLAFSLTGGTIQPAHMRISLCVCTIKQALPINRMTTHQKSSNK